MPLHLRTGVQIAFLHLIVLFYWLFGPVFGFPMNKQMQPTRTEQKDLCKGEKSVSDLEA